MITIVKRTSANKSYSPPEICSCSILEPQYMLAESEQIDPGTDDPWGDY
ncbi:MAG: hypothetical protein J6W82_05640 [Bacteroidales bacterium]|nr:hypothetical protein [Bacteroidales bacterium]